MVSSRNLNKGRRYDSALRIYWIWQKHHPLPSSVCSAPQRPLARRAYLSPQREAEEQAPQYSHIHFTSDLDEVLNDPQVKLVIVCTHADSHFDYANARWRPVKMCW
jgi:predicted dehydrogenase